jgi:hypothetical protein
MKNLIFLSFFICSVISCSKNEKSDLVQYHQVFDSKLFPQKWQLVKMTGNIPNSETTGVAMNWQESYLLNSDGSFTKSRKRDGKLTEGSGTFVFKDISGGKYLELTYLSASDIIGSCNADHTEGFWLRSDKLVGTWSYCDGPGLEYERVK